MGRGGAILVLALLWLLGPDPERVAALEGPAPKAAAEDPEVVAARATLAKARIALPDGVDRAKDGGRPRRLALLDVARALENLVSVLRRKKLPLDAEVAQLRAVYEELQTSAAGLVTAAGTSASARSPATRAAVDRALDWLARHQFTTHADGGWDSDGFNVKCRGAKCSGPGGPLYDPGLTGLALLVFLRAGETGSTPKYGGVVKSALKYMQDVQDGEGCFGPRLSNHFMYNHGVGALAILEAYRITRAEGLKAAATAAVAFIEKSRNPFLAWRYGVRPQDNDTSMTLWMVEALAEGKKAGLAVDPDCFQGAVDFLDHITDPETGRVGYTMAGNGPARADDELAAFPRERSEATTALGICIRLRSGQPKDHASIVKGLGLLDGRPPSWDLKGGCIDFYYWAFGTEAMRDAAEPAVWNRWRSATERALLSSQRGEKDGCTQGSWDPVDPWRQDGGRVYSTALATLALLACDQRELVAAK